MGLQFPLDAADSLSRLATRGAVFGDGSLYIAYRNVRTYGYELAFTHTTWQQLVILSVIGVPAAFLAGWAVELPYVGRRGALAISAGESLFRVTHVHHSTTSREIKG